MPDAVGNGSSTTVSKELVKKDRIMYEFTATILFCFC
jgi:hypothetical protein